MALIDIDNGERPIDPNASGETGSDDQPFTVAPSKAPGIGLGGAIALFATGVVLATLFSGPLAFLGLVTLALGVVALAVAILAPVLEDLAPVAGAARGAWGLWAALRALINGDPAGAWRNLKLPKVADWLWLLVLVVAVAFALRMLWRRRKR